ncbi:sensor domain-containing diguanylate cyclase [Vibrio sp. ABG19]|uniref:sensor domain-containing diguanylate cyclase n=1 Tax=Vibrio sp. ABG19 TaxID=2817385 RepID=UPI00249E9B54|nr:sensor domain-containing diguanylate cyclase [Vibrio sp. ABG19]WGY45363.1 GGDEF domain-containing protein [Vibrio sp. ABG19]
MLDKLNLGKLILVLCVFSVVVTLFNAFYSIYRVQHDLIINNTLESNRVYAEKMAEMTDAFIDSAMSQLKYSAQSLSTEMQDTKLLSKEVDRLKNQTDSFNSAFIVNADGVIVSISPETIEVKGIRLTSDRALQSLRSQEPLVTNPFVSPAGNYLISISYPIFAVNGDYLGYVAGSIYLEQKNILTTLLGKHSYKDGSYLYVVDRGHTLIYHPDKRRVGQVIVNNKAINTVLEGEKGSQTMFNSQGTEMLAGYAPVALAGWGIVAQRPKELTLSNLDQQMWNVVLETLPIALLTLLIIWISAFFISKPLWQLASAVRNFDSHSAAMDDLTQIKPWYFEASHLKRTFLNALGIVSNTIDQLQNDTLTDPMTGLLNRRGLEKAVDRLCGQHTPFAVLALDVDYFKRVNDTFGHDVGDELLKSVAQMIKKQARDNDVVCRAGGEEFIAFLTKTDVNQAFNSAERIRKAIENYPFDTVGQVTISIGVSYWDSAGEPINAILKNADDALYQAKHNGRNRTEIKASSTRDDTPPPLGAKGLPLR